MAELFQLHKARRYYQNLVPFLKTPEVQAYTMVILSLFTITFFGIFAIKPTLITITTLQRQIKDKNEVNQALDEKINALITAQEAYQHIEADLPIIYNLLPEKAEFPSLLRKLELLAIENSASISGVQFNPIDLYDASGAKPKSTSTPPPTESSSTTSQTTATKPALSQVQTFPVFFVLTVDGEYKNLVALLDHLTKLDRLVTINSVEINQRSGSVARLNVTIQAQAHYFPVN